MCIRDSFYTTDFFQESAFREGQQIISIYYTFQVADPFAIPVSTVPFNFKQTVEDEESFRWLDLSSAMVEDVTLSIDRVVLGMLIGRIDRRDGGPHAEAQSR